MANHILPRTTSICTKCLNLQTTRRILCHRNVSIFKNRRVIKHVKLNSDKNEPKFIGGFHSTSQLLNEEEDEVEFDEDEDAKYAQIFREYHKIPATGHSLFIIHPAVRWGPQRSRLTTPDLELDEACTLVKTLQNWSVAEKRIIKVDSLKTKHIFGSTKYEDLKEEIKRMRRVSAVFLNVTRLTTIQIAEFQSDWNIPVYDRYAIILQIFKEHAKTKIAKLQVSLAEIPYIRWRMEEIQKGTEDQQSGRAELVGGRGRTYMDVRNMLLQARERKLRKALVKVKQQRVMFRTSRKKKELPIIAVLGYTNSGKTTLIKALTGDARMLPENHLFATLDVTAHGGRLPNKTNVIYMDTVGFISNLHHHLIDAFSATLEDALEADVILHVRDISHPDTINQKANVIQTLQENLSEKQMEDIIEVCNKADQISQDLSCEDNFCVSAVTGQGLDLLLNKIQDKLFRKSFFMQKTFKIPSTGDHLSWLCQESTVQDIRTETDNSLIVDTVMTNIAYEKFKKQFSKKIS